MAAPASYFIFAMFSILLALYSPVCASENEKWKKKDIRDYNDADLERLFEQWEDNDEDELEEDEKPSWQKTPPKIDLTSLNMKDPEALMQASKTGKTVMMFATIAGKPDQTDTETISSVWHTGLINGNLDTRRFVTDPGRVMFVVDDGKFAWQIKDFLVAQDNCEEVTIEGKNYPGKAAKDAKKDEL